MFPPQIIDIDAAKYISSIGFMKACDDNEIINYIDPFKLTNDWGKLLSQGKNNSCIYVKMGHFRDFLNIINHIPFQFTLITGDGDETFPTDLISQDVFENTINNNKIKRWYSTNCNETIHPKLSLIPIGVNYHCDALWKDIPIKTQESIIETIRLQSMPFDKRIFKCYSTFHFSTYHNFGNPREKAIEEIPADLVFYEPDKISTQQTWINQSQYSFVISPHGNGLDCHRTWEALILGSIVIVKKSVLDPLYTELPVLIVDEWADITQELLITTIDKFKNLNFNYEKITLKYWKDKIHSEI